MTCVSDEKNIKKLIQETINFSHNKKLIDENMAPNANIIYHIYQDGEITSQKGSWHMVKGQNSHYIILFTDIQIFDFLYQVSLVMLLLQKKKLY